MLSSKLTVLSLLGLASGHYGKECVDNTLCFDAVNECGQKWGGCYNTCEPERRPTKPACETTSTATKSCTKTPDVTEEPTEMPTPTQCGAGDPIILCIDYINECGMMYGGCHDVCKETTPVYTPPPCPSTTTMVDPTPPPPPPAPTGLEEMCEDEDGPHAICVDGIDECGRGWGLCYDFCETPSPSFQSDTSPCEPTATATGTGKTGYRYYSYPDA